jgi:hypothetical protein
MGGTFHEQQQKKTTKEREKMNMTFLIITSALLLITAPLWLVPKLRERTGEFFANALIVNITPKGRATRLADNAFTARYLLAKAGSDASHIDICGAADIPLAVVPDMTPTTDTDLSYNLPANMLGLNEDTERVVASGATAVGDFLVPDAGGKVKTLPIHGGGTTYIVGRGLSAAAANNDQVEMVPCFPNLVTIPA